MLKSRKLRSKNEEISEKYEEGVIAEVKKGGNERKGHLRRRNNTKYEEQKLCRKEAGKSSVFTLFRLRCCITPPNIDMGMKLYEGSALFPRLNGTWAKKHMMDSFGAL
jgi:hypothetical protein